MTRPRDRGKAVSSTAMRGLRFQQLDTVRLIAKLAVLWGVLLFLPFAERPLLGAKTYLILYIGLALVFVLYGVTVRLRFPAPYETGAGSRLDRVSGVVRLHLQRSVSVCLRVRSSSARVRPIDRARSTSDRLPLLRDHHFHDRGYGDLVPSTAQGKLLAMCTALLGAAHGVTFVAIFLLALTRQPAARN